MKRGICIVVWCLAFYIAGRFKAEAILATVLASAIVGMVLLITVIYQAFVVKIDLKMERDFGKKEISLSGKIFLENRSFLPISKFLVCLEYFYEPYGKKEVQKIPGVLDGRGTIEIPFSIQPMYSGTLNIIIYNIKVWDILGIFCKKRKIGKESKITIFPFGKVMKIKEDRLKSEVFSIQENEQNILPGNNPPDVFQIHPYQQGEPLRTVHWKLTARLDEIMSRQYAEDMQILPVLYLQRAKAEGMNVKLVDAYWEVAVALSRGLLEADIPHQVVWNDQMEHFHRMEIYGEKDFLFTWKMAITYSCELEEKRVDFVYKQLKKENTASIPIICVNQYLVVLRDGEEIIRFSLDHYSEEMEKRWVSV